MFSKKNEQNEYDVVKSEQPFYTKEDALMEGTHVQESTLHDKPTELEVVEEWLLTPNEMQFLQQTYLYLIYRACAYIAKEKCPGCKSQLAPLSAQHKVISVGCQANDIVKNNFDAAKPLVTDKIVKDVFLSSWKKLQLVLGQNLDQMMGNIHMMYEDRENNELIFLKTQKHFSSHPHDWYNHQPLYLFLSSILSKQNLQVGKNEPLIKKQK